jgi:membrane-bound serine protease (ClpP class)
MFVADLLVTSHGVLTVAGIIAFILGSLMLVEAPVPAWRIGLGLVLPTALVLAAVMLFLGARVARSRARPPVVGPEALSGEVGEVMVPFERPGPEGREGKVFAFGEYWDAASSEPLAKGTRVRITGLHRGHLHVRPMG